MDKIIARLKNSEQAHLEELKTLLRFPSVSTAPEHKQDLRDCAQHLMSSLKQAGLKEVQLHETPGHPILTACWREKADAPTVMIYGHYDVQPVDPLELWKAPPFDPVMDGDKLVARGVADDKGQLFAHVKAIEALLAETGELPCNVVLLFEGEEEIGSPNLVPFLEANRELLKADCAVISDTAMFDRGRPSITYGLKGLCYMEVEVTGPSHDLHSGSFGGPVRNPLNAMAELLASLMDADGRILVEGFYDDVLPLSDVERKAFADLKFDEAALKASLDVDELRPETGYTPLEHLWARPTCDVNGMIGGFTGKGAKTVLPSQASAKFSFRLVPDQDPERVADLVEAHLKKHLPAGLKLRVTRHHGGPPALTPIDHPAVKAGMAALEKGFGVPAVYQREGGSIPIVGSFDRILGQKTVLMGFGLPDSRCHSPNENLAVENIFGGIRSALWFYTLLPEYMKGAGA
jgi:acetylornithine deacetylase/succinyl-diaminopimelate desuccinylase-like protein